jgi:MoxR-like ATPase
MNKTWKIFTNAQKRTEAISQLPDPPPWRDFKGELRAERDLASPPSDDLKLRGEKFKATEEMIQTVNAALCLRRPLLITGDPGSGKSSLIYAVAYELRLGEVLRWPITSRSTLQQGLYQYDAIGRLQEAQLRLQEAQLAKLSPGADESVPRAVASEAIDGDSLATARGTDSRGIGKYIKLGPLGTALLPSNRPRALLIDEIDKSDLDLPNDLLHVFEEGEFAVPELERLEQQPEVAVNDHYGQVTTIYKGRVKCRQFPFVILTSNGEREFPPAFLRRCLQLEMKKPDDREWLAEIVRSRLGDQIAGEADRMIQKFLDRRKQGKVAIDQLLNTLFILKNDLGVTAEDEESLSDRLLTRLD